jgi:hypothetical protein
VPVFLFPEDCNFLLDSNLGWFYFIGVKDIYKVNHVSGGFIPQDRPKGGKERKMPRGDRSGPMGYGPLSGRRMGFCAGYDVPGFANPRGGGGMGRAWGRGGGFGRGMAFRGGRQGWGGYPVPVGFPGYGPVEEASQIKSEIEVLEKTLETLKKRLDEVKGTEEE